MSEWSSERVLSGLPLGQAGTENAEFSSDIQANIPPSSIHERMVSSIDLRIDILLRAMTGASPLLGDHIRDVAESRALAGHPFETLDLVEGVPLRGLGFQGEAPLAKFGDFMHYGFRHGRHAVPEVHSTVISSRDYVGLLLTDDEAFASDDPYHGVRPQSAGHLNRVFDWPADRAESEAGRRALLDVYTAKQAEGKITAIVGQDPIAALRGQYEAGKRFDVVFPDLPAVADRFHYVQAVQACLAPDGRAFIPLTMWYPRLSGGGVTECSLIDDYVQTDDGNIPFEEFLATQHPGVFQVANYPGARSLVISGSEQPVQLPEFIPRFTVSSTVKNGVAINWVPVAAAA
jgi:hypothetical protein